MATDTATQSSDMNNDLFEICVFDKEDITTVVYWAIEEETTLADASNALKVALIRIELLTTSIQEAKSYFRGLESSILLYNFGTAYMCMTRTVRNDMESTRQLFKGALGGNNQSCVLINL